VAAVRVIPRNNDDVGVMRAGGRIDRVGRGEVLAEARAGVDQRAVDRDGHAVDTTACFKELQVNLEDRNLVLTTLERHGKVVAQGDPRGRKEGCGGQRSDGEP
jgi:hypothetical protein